MSDDKAEARREARARQQEGFARVQLAYANELEHLGEPEAASDARRDAEGHRVRADWIRRGMA